MSSLVMIEQPKTVVLSETTPRVDASNPDASLDKESLEKASLLDEEVTLAVQKPVTSSIRKTMRLLHSIGGFRARFRGLGVSIVYHIAHAIAVNLITMVMDVFVNDGWAPSKFILATILATILLCRIHMTWTHVMITQPSQLSWFKRIPQGKKYFKALILPSLAFSLAQYLTILMPIGVFFLFGGLPSTQSEVNASNETMRMLSAFATLVFVAVAILLPASVTLARVEASLLPENEETIVNFDRTFNGAATFAITENDVNARALFDAAWRSFDVPARVRLIGFFVKMTLIQTFIVICGMISFVTLFFAIGDLKLSSFVVAGAAQVQLAHMGVGQN